MERLVNYPVNDGGNFVIKPPRCSFFRHHTDETQITSNSSATR